MNPIYVLPEAVNAVALRIFHGRWAPYGPFTELTEDSWCRLALTDTWVAAHLLRRAGVTCPHEKEWNQFLDEFDTQRQNKLHQLGAERLLLVITGRLPIDPELEKTDNGSESTFQTIDRFRTRIEQLRRQLSDWLLPRQTELAPVLDQMIEANLETTTPVPA